MQIIHIRRSGRWAWGGRALPGGSEGPWRRWRPWRPWPPITNHGVARRGRGRVRAFPDAPGRLARDPVAALGGGAWGGVTNPAARSTYGTIGLVGLCFGLGLVLVAARAALGEG